jgi:hypothetical protein
MPIRHAIAEGLRAAKKNLLPGLLVQILMALFLFLYLSHEGTRSLLARLATTKQESGFAFAFVGYLLAAALLPELLKISFFQNFRPHPTNLKNFLIAAPFWGAFGVIVDLLYRAQDQWFGTDADIATILPKVLVDQFLFSPLIGAPLAILYFAWAEHGFRLTGIRSVLPDLPLRVLGIQCAAWMIWIPGVTLIYAMPSLLQIPIAILLTSFWILIFTTVRERQHRGSQSLQV